MNKYFAAQGYIVFDIQYGLYRPNRNADALTPLNVLGNFTIDDMLRHIGNFTYYLAKNANNFGANLDSVFISGGSAGGHLTCASALAINSGNYTDMFSSDLTIKGLIPFYPANLLPLSFGTDELIRPSRLVTSSSPPCLIFHGTHDGLVPWTVSQTLKDAYNENNNDECALLLFPFAGHASDIYFNGHFNLIFLYYMERFMYLYH
jgi:acetyl esterase/lipase